MRKQSIIYSRFQDKEMSGMIDDIIFQTLDILQSRQKGLAESTLVYEIFQRLKLNQRYPIICNDSKNYQTHSTFNTSQRSFLVNLHVKKPALNCTFTAVELSQATNCKMQSKHNNLLKMRQCLKNYKAFPAQANAYVINGKIYLVMNNFFYLNKLQRTSKIFEVYIAFVIKNLLNFENFTKKYMENKGTKAQNELQKQALFRSQLQITRILNTTHSTSNIAIDKSHFKFANTSFQKLKGQLKSIKQNINQQQWCQRSVSYLYQSISQEVNTSWLKQNLIPFYHNNQKILNSRLTLVGNNGQKKLEDFVYNMVKIEIKEMVGGNKPVNEGGFSYIYGARADVTFISSPDLQKLPHNNQKTEKFIAIKKLKPTQLKRTRNKLQHEKAIMNKMRGSTCQFMPKYYCTQKQSQLSNTLVMELIKGDQLDYYIQRRAETITLCSKLYLLLNVIQAVRHLINYKITHLDLKPINVLVTKSMVTKLIDFGESHHPQLCSKNYVPGITFPYTAPQIFVRYIKLSLNKQDDDWQYSEKQDAYAFGAIIYEMFFGGTIFPFSHNKFKEAYLKRQSFQRFFLAPQRVYDYGENLIMSHILYLIVRCMDPDPVKRPCFQWIGICLKLIQNSLQ